MIMFSIKWRQKGDFPHLANRVLVSVKLRDDDSGSRLSAAGRDAAGGAQLEAQRRPEHMRRSARAELCLELHAKSVAMPIVAAWRCVVRLKPRAERVERLRPEVGDQRHLLLTPHMSSATNTTAMPNGDLESHISEVTRASNASPSA